MNIEQVRNAVYVLTGVSMSTTPQWIDEPRIEIFTNRVVVWDPELELLVEYFRGLGIHVSDFTKMKVSE